MSLIDAAVAQGGRLPELFSGLDRADLGVPVGYPTSCSPQAWSAASPLLCLRTLLRLDPWVPYGKTWLAPMVPPEIGRLRVEGIPLAGSRVDVEVVDGLVERGGHARRHRAGRQAPPPADRGVAGRRRPAGRVAPRFSARASPFAVASLRTKGWECSGSPCRT